MLKNYIKIALRNMRKHKLFSAINIFGMAISLASFFIICIYVLDEFKYDRHIKNAEDKYRVYIEWYRHDSFDKSIAPVPPMFGKSLSENYPEVEYSTRILNVQTSRLITYKDKAILEPTGVFAENSVVDMFDIQIIRGDAVNPLTNGNKVALSETLAIKLFADEDPIGKMLNISDIDFEVSAIYKDFLSHTHLRFSHILSFDYLYEAYPERMERWTWQQFLTYVKLREDASAEQLMDKFLGEVKEKAWPESKKSDNYYIPKTLPLKDVHLHASTQAYDMADKGNAQTIYILLGTAFFILIIACLNFINLSTARASSRMKEVGLRKVIGAQKRQLIFQFIGEAVIITVIALVIAGIITELVLPYLGDFTEKTFSTGLFFNVYIILALLLFAVIIGTAAGAYPAFHIAAYKPSDILSSGRSNPKGGKVLFRKILVTLQFVITFFLITGAIVVSQQNAFISEKDLGFNYEHVIAVSTYGQIDESLLKRQFLSDPGIVNATAGYGLPGEAYAGDGIITPEDGQRHSTTLLTVDYDYVKTLQGEILAGRDFDINRPSDSLDAFIINEKALEIFDAYTPEEAIGKKIEWPQWHNGEHKRGEIIGVVKNMHMATLKEQVMPMVMHIYPFAYNTVTVRVKPGELQSAISHMETEWKRLEAEWPFTYRFLDQNFDKMYKAETRLNVLFKFFTGFTIIVASLGLLGLVIYSLTLKMKEVGIRKVLGAGIPSLVFHLSKGYMVLMIIAFVLAIPFSYYAATKWLQDFQYKIEISALIFVYAGLIIFGVTLVTVLIQSLKTALLNPVDVIKDE